jgi:hypothetical protein
MFNRTETIDALIDIRNHIEELLHEAERLLRGTSELAPAQSYWLAGIRSALGVEGRSMHSMTDTIRALGDRD